MKKQMRLLVILSLSLFSPCHGDDSSAGIIPSPDYEERANITVLSLRNTFGKWITTFSAEKAIDNTTKGVHLDINQDVLQCGQKQYLRISGVIRDVEDGRYSDILESEVNGEAKESILRVLQQSDEKYNNLLRFDTELKGMQAVVIKNGKAAYRKSPQTNTGAYGNLVTNRPLKDNELFEIRIEETIDLNKSWGLAFGVIEYPPSDIGHIKYILWKNRSWGLHQNIIFKNKDRYKENYPFDLRNLPIGTRIGVMRKGSGKLHFFRNGNDMGEAAENVPEGVYGFLDLINDVTMVSLVS